MRKRFAIKSKYFSLYQAIREEAVKIGWVYNSEFTPFAEGKTDSCNCLFFSTEWDFNGWDPRFAFSNHGETVFNIPEQWNEAIEYMRSAYDNNKPGSPKKEKLTISIKDLANHHGVGVDDIVITS